MERIIRSIMGNDVAVPLRQLMNERRALRRATSSSVPVYSMYRDILFLAFTALGRDNIDQDSFDKEYRAAFSYINPRDLQKLKRFDHPPKSNAVWCRKMFSELELR
jgi:hypothetical protein